MREQNVGDDSSAGLTNPHDLARLWRERKRVILVAATVIFTVIASGTFLMPPVYEASAKLMVERELQPEKALLFRMNMPANYEKYDWLKAEIEIINSYPVAARVVRNQDDGELASADGMLPANGDDISFKKTVKRFRKKLRVERKRNSNVIEVAFEHKDPRVAAETVNRVVDTYLRYHAEIDNQATTYSFLEKQIEIADNKLRELEARQANYKQQQGVFSTSKQAEIILARLSDYETSLTTARRKCIAREAKLNVIKKQFEAGGKISIPATEVSDSPSREKYIAKLKGEVLDMEMKRDRLLQRFKPQYEEIVDLGREITASKEKIRQEVLQIIKEEETAIQAMRAEERALKREIAKTNSELREFARKQYEIEQITRGLEDNRDIYSMLLKQREESRITSAKQQRGVKIRVFSPAVAPVDPVRPRKLLNLLLGLFLGIFGGIGLAYFIDVQSRSGRAGAEQVA